jgi:hypothetical protein
MNKLRETIYRLTGPKQEVLTPAITIVITIYIYIYIVIYIEHIKYKHYDYDGRGERFAKKYVIPAIFIENGVIACQS